MFFLHCQLKKKNHAPTWNVDKNLTLKSLCLFKDCAIPSAKQDILLLDLLPDLLFPHKEGNQYYTVEIRS